MFNTLHKLLTIAFATIFILAAAVLALDWLPKDAKVGDTFEADYGTDVAVPGHIVLQPGQSAVLLNGVEVVARIPAQGNQLYTGPVWIPQGTIVLVPKTSE